MEYRLQIKYKDGSPVKDYYRNHCKKNRRVENWTGDNMAFLKNEDSGFDLFVSRDYTFKKNQTILVDLDISCEMIHTTEKGLRNVAYYLYPRSSIYKYDLVMMNSTGIIDRGYRGNIMVPLKWLGNSDTNPSEKFTLDAGTRVCQICSDSLEPFDTYEVDHLTDSERGVGGFGSTGKGQ